MKFLALNGSPRAEGHTAKLLEVFIEAAKTYGDCERLDLYELNLPFVSGQLDVSLGELNIAHQKILEADAFVLATPTYWFNLPAVVKNFIDHLTVLEDNGFLLEGKVAGAIVYCPEGGGVNVLQNLAMVWNQMGITVPPYGLIFDRGQERDQSWVSEDIPRLAHSLAQQVNAHQKLGFHWDI